MGILIILGLVVSFVYIGYLVSRLDKFLAKGGLINENDEIYPSAIVLGGTDIAKEINELLKSDMIYVLSLAEPFLLEQKQNFHYLFALSENDVDNIVLCEIGKKLYGIEKNESMFMREKITYVIFFL